jgi:uncharacterized membrane protein YidH (DUF202 family)
MRDTDSGVRASLANERTHLAWQRTAMSWGAAGAVTTRYFAEDGVLRGPTLVGVAMIVVAALMWFDGERRYRTADAAIRLGASPRVSVATIRTVAAATTIAIAAAVIVEVAT